MQFDEFEIPAIATKLFIGSFTHLHNGSTTVMGKLAHKIKSSVAMMGIKELTTDMKTLECIAIEGKNKQQLTTLISKFKVISSEAIIELNTIPINLK